MDFEELQKIWDTQKKQTLYAINETAMYNHIMKKKRQSNHIIQASELVIILTNVGSAAFIAFTNATGSHTSIAMYALSGWMLLCACFTLAGRIHRMRGARLFDRSMNGELAHALSVATYQVGLASIMRWNVLPIGILLLLGLWETGKPLWVAAAMVAVLLLGHYASRREYRYYERRKQMLQNLKASLMQKATPADLSTSNP